ncbi:MAG: N-acetylmuramoyl-L-alanine amidase [Clostridia bacterium]|nr:N-acetylmuramoyl-L-alanine amidase [Clostridia bacterium]
MYSKKPLKGNYNDRVRLKKEITHIVVHFTANNGDTARGNLNYFAGNLVKASAHFFVDEREVCASVPELCIAYHCGGKKYLGTYPEFYGVCYNSNSIGVELCSRKDDYGEDGYLYYFLDKTVENAARLVAELMVKYDIPMKNVIRHYDVTGKKCPAPFVYDEGEWVNFKRLVASFLEDDAMFYEKLDEIPAGELRETVRFCVDKGIVKGTGSGLHLTMDNIRMLVFCKRMIENEKKTEV